MAKRDSGQAKGSLNVRILRGDDQELVSRRLREILAPMRSSGAEIIDVTAGVDEVDSALKAANQSFMFTDLAVVVIRDASKLSADERALASAVIENGIDPNFLIFVDLRDGRSGSKAEESDAANVAPKPKDSLIELIKKVGVIDSVDSPTGKGRRGFVEESATRFALDLSPGATDLILEHLGDDLGRLESILAVLQSRYGPSSRIEPDDLLEYLGVHGAVPFWGLTEAIEKGDASGALDILKTVTQDQGRDPVILVAVMAKRLSELAAISSASTRRAEDVNAALYRGGLQTEKASKHPYVAEKMIPVAKSLGFEEYRQAFNWLSEADRALRGDPVLPQDMALEILVARLASMYRRKKRVATR